MAEYREWTEQEGASWLRDKMPSLAPTLTEFLLARIAEDEREAVLRESERNMKTAEYARALAETEAKRRIVAANSKPMILFGGHLQWAYELLCLASVYADHEDYREEWRP